MEEYFEGFSEEITKWDIIRELLDLDIDDKDTEEAKQQHPGVQLLPRQDAMLYGSIPKMEQKVYSRCKECRLVFNPRDVLAHKNCSGKAYNSQQSLLKKKAKSKGSSSKKPHNSSVPPPPLFKKLPSPPLPSTTATPAATSASPIVLPELKVSVTKVVLPKIPKLTTVSSSSTTPTCTTASRTSDTAKSSSKSHSSHKSSGHGHSSSHHHESSSSSSSSRHGHGHHGHGHSPGSSSSGKYRHKKSRKSGSAAEGKPAASTAGLNSEEHGPRAPCGAAEAGKAAAAGRVPLASAHRVQHLKKIVPHRSELGGRKDEKEIFCQNTSYVPIVTKIVSTIETTTPLITTYIMPKSTMHSRQLSTSVLASKKSNVMESETLKNGFIAENLDNTQDNSCVNVPIVFMPMSPISIVNPATQMREALTGARLPQASLHAGLLKPKPFFLPIPSSRSNIQIYKSHPKPVAVPTFGARKVGGAVAAHGGARLDRQRGELLELLGARRRAAAAAPHRPNILKSRALGKRHAGDRPAAGESKQMRLVPDVNGFILRADVSEADAPRNNCIQEKIALLNMK